MNINQLSVRFLWKIFDLIPEKSVLLLVSKDWKRIIESQHVFERSTFFNRSRTKEETKMALESSRRYREFAILQTPSNQVNYRVVQEIFENNKKTFWNVYVHINMDKKMTYEKFLRILESLETAESINLFIESMKIQGDKDKTIQPNSMHFKYLQELNIKYQNGDRVIGKLLNCIKAPNLKSFNCQLSTFYGTAELDKFFDFINRSKKLESVSLLSPDDYGLNWSPSHLQIFYTSVMHEKLEKFLENRLKNLKQFSFHGLWENQLIDRVFKEAEGLEHFETNIKPPFFSERRVCRNIKTLNIWEFSGDCGELRMIHECFPDIEIFYTTIGYIDRETKDFMMELFENLREVKLYNSATNLCDIVV
jgi:hypothetical protein